ALVLLTLAAGCSRQPAVSTAEATQPPASAAATVAPPIETRPPNSKDFRPAFAGQTRAPSIKTSFALDVSEVATNLDSAWAFEFLPDGRVLVTEKLGRLRIIGTDRKVSAPVEGLPKVFAEGQGGLLDVALDPKFADNHTLYWSYAEPRKGGNGTALAKGVLTESGGKARVEQVQVIFRQMPTFDSKLHFGSRIVFAPDGKLFLTLGERSVPETRVLAQDLGKHFGKVVRINPDGSVPNDNPFVGRSDAKPEIWSYGHRNVQGATLDTQGRLWTIEHGPRGGDELNRPQAGLNYGWPIITYGIEYHGPKIGAGITAKEGLEQPVYYWDPVIAPSGMTFYDGDLLPEWKGNLFIASLLDMKLVRLQLTNDKVTGEEWLLQDRKQRVRDVKQGPDGALYVLTEAGDGALLRVGRKGT
ncbi:MAG TPA: PQQ-dependent sugar dehydrogenase, partial [Povalibacter sp.]